MPHPTFMDIRFTFKNFAGISTCEMSLCRLTVISGPNSAGKTYVAYAIYSFLRELGDLCQYRLSSSDLQQLMAGKTWSVDLSEISAKDLSKRASAAFKGSLPRYFSVPDDFFSAAEVSFDLPLRDYGVDLIEQQARVGNAVVSLVKPAGSTVATVSLVADEHKLGSYAIRAVVQSLLTDVILGHLHASPFAITSERTGISLFWKELDINKNQIIEKLIEKRGKKFDPWEFVSEQTSRYALPITDNIDVARDAENVAKLKSFIAQDVEVLKYVKGCFDRISGGKFRYSKDGIAFEFGRGKGKSVIPIYVASSSTKSLFLLDLFINHIAVEGQLLVFDEPELNLHPENQRVMAQLICRLVSVGVVVLMTTHSDFLIREVNNRIMLSKVEGGASRQKVLDRNGIAERELIQDADVCGYLLTKDRRLVPVAKTKHGLDVKTIEDAIVGASTVQGEVLGLLAASEH